MLYSIPPVRANAVANGRRSHRWYRPDLSLATATDLEPYGHLNIDSLATGVWGPDGDRNGSYFFATPGWSVLPEKPRFVLTLAPFSLSPLWSLGSRDLALRHHMLPVHVRPTSLVRWRSSAAALHAAGRSRRSLSVACPGRT